MADVPLILLTNDDGIRSPGLDALSDAMKSTGDVWVFAPDRERSAVGHGISLHRPLRVTPLRDQWFMVDGTPTDCVLLAVRKLLPRRPALVISGINTGQNLGDDVTYSGTVAGAYEGMLLRVPSVAVSHASSDLRYVGTTARCARLVAEHILEHGLPPDTVLNVNVPNLPYEELTGVAITRQGLREYEDEVIERHDPRGVPYYWIGGAEPSHIAHTGTDFEAIERGSVSITPLHRDLTNYNSVPDLQRRTIIP